MRELRIVSTWLQSEESSWQAHSRKAARSSGGRCRAASNTASTSSQRSDFIMMIHGLALDYPAEVTTVIVKSISSEDTENCDLNKKLVAKRKQNLRIKGDGRVVKLPCFGIVVQFGGPSHRVF